MMITERHIKMNKGCEEFYEVFLQELHKYSTQEECFYALHEEYKAIFGKELWSSFDSFRISNLKRLKKPRK